MMSTMDADIETALSVAHYSSPKTKKTNIPFFNGMTHLRH